jgi:hypothetical protein
VPALFELFVKRERPQQVSYRILPNFVEFLVGRLISGVATVSSRCATRAVLPRMSSSTGWCGFGREVGRAQRRRGGIVRDSSWTVEIIHE